MAEKEEYSKLMADMRSAFNEVRASKFYRSINDEIRGKPEIISNLEQVFGSRDEQNKIPIVIPRLGSIQYTISARFHLALALLLRAKVGGELTICCDELTLNAVEKSAFEAMGCRIIVDGEDGRARWIVDKPTLFFLPFARPEVLGDLLAMNWSPSRMKMMVFLGSSFMAIEGSLIHQLELDSDELPVISVKKLTFVGDRLRYVWAISEYIKELKIGDGESEIHADSNATDILFDEICWHFFYDLDELEDEDMDELLPSTMNCFKWVDSETSFPYRMDEEDVEEVLRVKEEMEITMQEVKKCEFYVKLREQLQENSALKIELSRRLESVEKVQFVVYALGSIELFFCSQYQLALVLLLRQEMDILKIEEIQVFDPVTTPVDAKVMRSLGCNVLSVNEFFRRRAEKPTLFFLPFPSFHHVGNLLEVNWSPLLLENVIILGNGLHSWDHTNFGEGIESMADRLWYLHKTRSWRTEYPIDQNNRSKSFERLSWQFFHLLPGDDLNAQSEEFPAPMKISTDQQQASPLEDILSKLRVPLDYSYSSPSLPDFMSTDDSRGQSCNKKTWIRPLPDWLKLNFDGCSGVHANGYGGTLCNNAGETLVSYAGPMKAADPDDETDDMVVIMAQVEGLRHGVKCFKELHHHQLIMEGSALSVIRWMLDLIIPPERFAEVVGEVINNLRGVNCVVSYVYPEANIKAFDMARLGASLPEFRMWNLRLGEQLNSSDGTR
ncbi:hypothetical protein J5N97_009488 [Dioscorea zingiberensis]|uniref:SRR1-like domain-containing protein n=1 Tax=Dioscorea zingiberensis TaxID=325984 RepID=A0A9D5CZG3_9LILI|nr:hypothetical protein J5N97_009488 [Dioscorea zingiberensis]